jgi:hypothetical protein
VSYVSELRPPTGLLFTPHAIYVCGEPRWNYTDRGKPKNPEKSSVKLVLLMLYLYQHIVLEVRTELLKPVDIKLFSVVILK